MRRLGLLVCFLVCAGVLAGCGGSSSHETSSATTTAAAPAGPGTTLYAGGDWAVVLDGTRATAFHRVGGAWRSDTSGAVQVRILGPKPGESAAATPQVAAELSAAKPLVESGLWVDGSELLVKGGGLRPTRGTIYGAPGRPLAAGRHVAVAYARTGGDATAVAWSFRVR